MIKFWEWMEKKGYCHSLIDGRTIKTQYEKIVIPTGQMLIGYYFEFIIYGLSKDLIDLLDWIQIELTVDEDRESKLGLLGILEKYINTN